MLRFLNVNQEKVIVSHRFSLNDLRSWQKCTVANSRGFCNQKNVSTERESTPHVPLKLPEDTLRAGHQATINKTKTEEEEPDFHCDRQRDRWTKRAKRAASNRKWCGHHAGTCHASLVQDEEVKLAATERQTAAERTSVPEQTREVWTHPGCCSL